MFALESLHPIPAGWVRCSGIPVRYRGILMSDMDQCRAMIKGKPVLLADSPVADWLAGIREHGLMHENAKGLLLVGLPGAGKSRLLSALLQEVATTVSAAHLGHSSRQMLDTPVGFTTFASLVETRKDMMSMDTSTDEWGKANHKVEIFNGKAGKQWDVRVAGIDDVGKEHTTASRFAEDSFDYLLRHRFDLGYPTIVTSNMPRKDWDVYGSSMVSFANEALTEVVIMNKKGDGRQ